MLVKSKKIISIIGQQQYRALLVVMLLQVLMAAMEMLGVFSILPFLAILSDPALIQVNPVLNYLFISFGDENVNKFYVWFGISVFIVILTVAIFRAYVNWRMIDFVEGIRRSLSERLLLVYLDRDYEYFLDSHSSNMSKTILSEVDQFSANIFRPFILGISYLFVSVGLVGLLLLIDPIICLATIAVLCSFYLTIYRTLKSKLKMMGEELVAANKERFHIVNETFSGIKLIKLEAFEDFCSKRFKNPALIFSKTNAAHQIITLLPSFAIEAIAFGGLILLVVFKLLTSPGSADNALASILPVIGVFAFALYRLQPAVKNVFAAITSVKYGEKIIENISGLLEYDVSSSPSRKTKYKIKRGIELRDISFRYPNSINDSIKSASLYIRAGETVGIVGKSGSGKTTLIDVILGLLKPSSGGLYVDGKLITQLDMQHWTASIGYVPQEIFLIDKSIKENVTLGRKDYDGNSLSKAIKNAELNDFVSSLANSFDTEVGERGVRISGGQKQRLGIARALFKEPSLLIFDEATSALDIETELKLVESIRNSTQSITKIIVAHRKETLKYCDRIFKVTDGSILEVMNN